MGTALIVEDDIVNQRLLESILKELSYKTIIAENGEEAVLIYRNNKKLSIILMDMHMPYLNGLDAVKIMRDIEIKEKRNRLPIIAVTSFALDGNREICISAGCDDYIAKPYKRETLTKLINKYAIINKTFEKSKE